jgi:ubiquinone/menaquinone biosynthesis C-methylase UbiE/transcriptional regulator with XRE-family HTH domain
MIDKNNVGLRISYLRKNLGYSQSDLSRILNVSPQAVSKWESGLSIPDIDVLLNISWIFKTTINNIIDNDDFIEDVQGVERHFYNLSNLLICPQCKNELKLNKTNINNLFYECNNGHRYNVIDGVVDFGTREIPGEQWSLSFRNYEEYLHEHHWEGNENYKRGLNRNDIIWEQLDRLRPRIILDMACGTGQGIKHQIKRINWPVTIIMVDLSHRILKWNKIFYSTEWRNPYVDMVYLACDGANLPVKDNSIDVVFSCFGYESMQNKMMDGFREAYRVLKNGEHTIYTKSIVDDYNSDNSKKWIGLLFSELNDEERHVMKNMMPELNQWQSKCQAIGFIENTYTKIYDELPMPETDKFPFENEIMQWMAEYVFTSKKHIQ